MKDLTIYFQHAVIDRMLEMDGQILRFASTIG